MPASLAPSLQSSKRQQMIQRDADHRLGHKKRQRARNKELKRLACQEVLDRLPPYQNLPFAIVDNVHNDEGADLSVTNTDTKKSKGISDLYRPIPRPETAFRKFWDRIPPICSPHKAVLEGEISDKRELEMDRYHSEKYRRKLQYKKERGKITQAELEELWEKHGKRTKHGPAKKQGENEENGNNASNTGEGISLLSNDRGQRKAWQVENFVSILWDRLSSFTVEQKGNTNKNNFYFTVVDFGSGSGNLCLALAPYFSNVRFVLVDKKPYPLKLAERRANQAGLKNVQTLQYSFSPSNLDDFSIPPMPSMKTDLFLPPGTEMTPASTPQVSSAQMSSKEFDIAIGLHCCGSFTDMVMSLAKIKGADCIVCPCCNGAMTSKTTCGYKYPRSSYIGKLMNQDEYLSMSKAAEDSGIYEAKCLIEYDRALWAKENGYHVQLLKMSPDNCTPKHHVLYLTNSEEKV